jgi:hypothetical protein
MKIMITNLARLCSVIFIAAMVTTTALATPIHTYVNYDIYNITDLSSTSNTFTIDTTDNKITAVNLGFTSLDNLSFTSILFDSGKINNTDDTLTFYSSANNKDSLVIKLATNTTLGSSANLSYQYFIRSAIINDYTRNNGSQSSQNLVQTVQTTRSGGHDDNGEHDDEHEQSQYKTVSYMQDPPTVIAPVTASDTASVPEPTILALFTFALIGFGLSRRKRNQARN